MDFEYIAREYNGVFTARQAESDGLRYARLSEAVSEGRLVRVSRGVYSLPQTWEDEYWITQQRFKRGIYSDGTSLFLHDFADRTPEHLTMTFPRSYNATGARGEGILVRTCAKEVFELGITQARTPSGNYVRAYNLERTLCDMVRGRAVSDAQMVNPAMREYARKYASRVEKLYDYAERLGVLKKVRGYMEVLL